MQSDDRPLLTIAVPTFNRSQYLSVLLSFLAPQLKDESRVELLISDNASTDDTQATVRRFAAEGLPLRYIRNGTNAGPDWNFLQCYEQAAGRYVWIVGDDDVIEPFGLKKVLSYLSSGEEYDLLFLRSRGFTGAYEPQVQPSSDKSILFTRAEVLACHVHVFFTFISGIIVNKKRISSLPHRPFTDLIGTGLVQLGWTYTALEHHRRSIAIETPVIATLTNNTGGYSLFRVFGANLGRITGEWLTSEQVKGRIIRGTLLSFFPYYLLTRETDSAGFIRDDPHKVLGPVFGGYMHYWLFDFPLIELPFKLGAIWFLMIRIVNKIDKLLGRPMLRISVFDKAPARKSLAPAGEG